MKTLPIELLPVFLEEARKSRHYPIYFLAITSGMRRGELLGLRWQNVDLDNGVVSVTQQLTRVDGILRLTELKTALSRRRILIPPETIDVLKAHKKQQAASRIKLGNAYKMPELVFANEMGGPIDPVAFSAAFKRLIESAGLPPIRLHDLRHTYATWALERGASIKAIQESLGHHSAAFTLSVYGHATDTMRKATADKISQALKEGLNGAFLYDKSVSVKALKDAEHLRLFLYNKGVIGTAWAFLDQSIRKINCRPSLVVSIRLSRLKDKRLSCHEPN